MKKIISTLILGVCTYGAFAQNGNIQINGCVQDNWNPANVILAASTVMQDKTIQNVPIASSVNGKHCFKFSVPAGIEPGIYKIKTWQKDIIIDGKEKEIAFNMFRKPGNTNFETEFSASEQNKAWEAYKQQTTMLLGQIDNYEKNYVSTGKTNIQLLGQINSARNMYQEIYNNFCKKYKGTYAGLIVKNTVHKFAPIQMNDIEKKKYLHQHYWDGIETSNPKLINSSFFQDLIAEYIIYYFAPELNYGDAASDSLINASDLIVSKFSGNQKTREYAIKHLEAALGSIAQYKALRHFDEKYGNELLKYCDKRNSNDRLLDSLYRSRVKGYAVLAKGKPAPNITVTDKTGKTIGLKDIKSENVVVLFWSVTCGHCEKEMPRVEQYLESHNNPAVVAVCISQNEAAYNQKKSAFSKMLFHRDGGEWQGPLVKAYYITATPVFLLLDKNRNFIGTYYSWDDIVKELK